MSIKAVPPIIFGFVVGGMVAYVLWTGLAPTAPVALADAVPIPDAQQGEIRSPAPIPPRPPSQDIAKSAGTSASPTTPTRTHTTEPPVTLATTSREAIKTLTAPLIKPSPKRKPRKHQVTTDLYARDANAQHANMHRSTVILTARTTGGTREHLRPSGQLCESQGQHRGWNHRRGASEDLRLSSQLCLFVASKGRR